MTDAQNKATTIFFLWLDELYYLDQSIKRVAAPVSDNGGEYCIVTGKNPKGDYKVYLNGKIFPYRGAAIQKKRQ
jgi:hypothetical protein